MRLALKKGPRVSRERLRVLGVAVDGVGCWRLVGVGLGFEGVRGAAGTGIGERGGGFAICACASASLSHMKKLHLSGWSLGWAQVQTLPHNIYSVSHGMRGDMYVHCT